MKVTIEFNLPEEAAEYEIHQKAYKYYSALSDLAQVYRNRAKWNTEDSKKLTEYELMDEFWSILKDAGVDDLD